MYTPMHSSTIEATPNPTPSLTEHTEALCSEMYPGICDIPVSACRGGGLAAVALSYLTTWPLPLSGLLGSRPRGGVRHGPILLPGSDICPQNPHTRPHAHTPVHSPIAGHHPATIPTPHT